MYCKPKSILVAMITLAFGNVSGQEPPAPQPASQATSPEGAPQASEPAPPQPAPAGQPTTEATPTPAPAADQTDQPRPSPATVIEVEGSAQWALPGVSPLVDEGWTPIKVGDQLQPSTQIRTGLRTRLNLQFGQTTTISIRSITHASIEQFYRSATTENVRIDLGYGTVRGGTTEGTIKSDIIVDSPIATLAKRGTEGWEIQVEPGLGRFRIALAQHGLVEAMQKISGDRTRSRLVEPGQYATDANIANLWINQAVFDRVVAFYEPNETGEADAEFMTNNNRGLAVLSPGGGSEIIDLSGRVSAQSVLARTSGPPGVVPDIAVGFRPAIRPEGNFGTPRTFRAVRAR